MAARNVTKNTLLFIIFFSFTYTSFSQKAKYLLFDNSKDSIVTLDNVKHYKINNNLFDIYRFAHIDTICKKKFEKIKFTNVEELWMEGEKASDSILKDGVKKERIKIIESNNQIFEKIYVIERISESKFKRTRVWWIDY